MPIPLIDATRISDGRKVILKVVGRGDSEVEIIRYLSQDSFLSDERNHCVPLLEVLDTGKGDSVFLVMPLLRGFDDPEFISLDDAVEFVQQTLEVCRGVLYDLFKISSTTYSLRRGSFLCTRRELPIGALLFLCMTSYYT